MHFHCSYSFIICGTLMKSNYALASIPLKCNLDHLSEILKRELPRRHTGNTCFNHCQGSFSQEPASLLALCNLKYGVTFPWATFLAKIFISKKSGTAGNTDLYLHKREKKNGQEYEIPKKKPAIKLRANPSDLHSLKSNATHPPMKS